MSILLRTCPLQGPHQPLRLDVLLGDFLEPNPATKWIVALRNIALGIKKTTYCSKHKATIGLTDGPWGQFSEKNAREVGRTQPGDTSVWPPQGGS